MLRCQNLLITLHYLQFSTVSPAKLPTGIENLRFLDELGFAEYWLQRLYEKLLMFRETEIDENLENDKSWQTVVRAARFEFSALSSLMIRILRKRDGWDIIKCWKLHTSMKFRMVSFTTFISIFKAASNQMFCRCFGGSLRKFIKSLKIIQFRYK